MFDKWKMQINATNLRRGLQSVSSLCETLKIVEDRTDIEGSLKNRDKELKNVHWIREFGECAN